LGEGLYVNSYGRNWEGGGGLRSPLVSRVQGAKMSVLNDKRDFLHMKDFKIRNRIKGNTIIASLVYSLRVGNFNYPAPDAKKKSWLRHGQQQGSFGFHNKTTPVKGRAVGKEQQNSSQGGQNSEPHYLLSVSGS